MDITKEEFNEIIKPLYLLSGKEKAFMINAISGNFNKLEESKLKNIVGLDHVRLSSDELIQSLGECKEGNGYIIEPSSEGRWWIINKAIGSGEPLKQWIDNRPEPDEA